jgi:hypothetical protein
MKIMSGLVPHTADASAHRVVQFFPVLLHPPNGIFYSKVMVIKHPLVVDHIELKNYQANVYPY